VSTPPLSDRLVTGRKPRYDSLSVTATVSRLLPVMVTEPTSSSTVSPPGGAAAVKVSVRWHSVPAGFWQAVAAPRAGRVAPPDGALACR
jgi:hypothetical protein